MTVKSEVLIRLSAQQVGGADFGPQSFTPEIKTLLQMLSGTTAGQSDRVFVDERSVAASTNDDIDLAGSLVDAFGATLTFVQMTALLIINAPKTPGAAANLSNLTIGLGSNPFLGFLGGTTPTIGPLRPGAALLLMCGGAGGIGTVTAATADILRIANGAGGTAVYQIGVLGRSA